MKLNTSLEKFLFEVSSVFNSGEKASKGLHHILCILSQNTQKHGCSQQSNATKQKSWIKSSNKIFTKRAEYVIFTWEKTLYNESKPFVSKWVYLQPIFTANDCALDCWCQYLANHTLGTSHLVGRPHVSAFCDHAQETLVVSSLKLTAFKEMRYSSKLQNVVQTMHIHEVFQSAYPLPASKRERLRKSKYKFFFWNFPLMILKCNQRTRYCRRLYCE